MTASSFTNEEFQLLAARYAYHKVCRDKYQDAVARGDMTGDQAREQAASIQGGYDG